MSGEGTTNNGTSAPEATPALPDFDSMDVNAIREMIANGPEGFALPVAGDQAAAGEEAVPAVQGDLPAAAPAPDPTAPDPEKKDEEPPTDEPEPVADFAFTPNADWDTFAKEAAAYLETVEVTPQIQQMLDRYEARLSEVATSASTDDFTARAISSLNRMADVRRTEDGGYAADTSEFIQFLRQEYTREFPDIVRDMVMLPSSKYNGYTTFQEYIRDFADLDDNGMVNLQTFLDNKGEFPIPTFVPDGIDQRVSEAYWKAPNRSQIDQVLENAVATIVDEYSDESDKAEAKLAIQQINQALRQQQQGHDAQAEMERRHQADVQRKVDEIDEKAAEAYLNTSVSILRGFSDKLANALTFLDPNGAKTTALAYATLAEKAVVNDQWSKYAQEDLTALGVKFDWQRGRTELDRLYEIEHKIAAMQANPSTNPRALELAKKNKADVIRSITLLETELLGKITKVAVAGAVGQAKKSTAALPKTPAVRPKAKAPAPAGAPAGGEDWERMTPEEIQSRLGLLRHEIRTKTGMEIGS